jgi:hypothetical protein
MSVTVVYPTGCVARYSCANYINWSSDSKLVCKLYKSDPTAGGEFVAAVPVGCIVSFQHPDQVQCFGTPPPMSINAALEIVAKSCQGLTSWQHGQQLAELKLKLRRFNARKRQWNP